MTRLQRIALTFMIAAVTDYIKNSIATHGTDYVSAGLYMIAVAVFVWSKD